MTQTKKLDTGEKHFLRLISKGQAQRGEPVDCEHYEECRKHGSWTDDAANAMGASPWAVCFCGVVAAPPAPQQSKDDANNGICPHCGRAP